MSHGRQLENLISVIVPVYGVEEYLSVCIESVIAQTNRNWELILVDDGSKDNSGTICDEYAQKDSRIVVIHQKNQGVSAARNAGIDRARGEYIAFIDGDDYVEPDYLDVLLRDILEQGADMVCCTYTIPGVDEDQWKPLVQVNRLVREYDTFFEDMTAGKEFYWVFVWGKLCKASFIRQCRFQSMRYSEDVMFMFDLFLQKPVVYLDQYQGYHYVLREGSAMTSAGEVDFIKRKNDFELEYYRLSKLPEVRPAVYNAMLSKYARSIHGLAYAVALQKDWNEYDKLLDFHAKEGLKNGKKLPAKYKVYLGLIAYLPAIYRVFVRFKYALLR